MKKEQWIDAVKFVGLGWYVGVTIFFGVAGGASLDRWAGTSPIFTLVGILVGLIVAVWGVYRMFAPLLQGNGNRKKNNSKEEEK